MQVEVRVGYVTILVSFEIVIVCVFLLNIFFPSEGRVKHAIHGVMSRWLSLRYCEAFCSVFGGRSITVPGRHFVARRQCCHFVYAEHGPNSIYLTLLLSLVQGTR